MNDNPIWPWDLPDENTMAQQSLDFKVALKARTGRKGWKIYKAPEGKSLGHERWPHDLTDQAQKGDELWWFSSPPKTWEHLCGRAGWALVRDGQVIDTEVIMMN